MGYHSHASHTTSAPSRHVHRDDPIAIEVLFPLVFIAPILILAVRGWLKAQAGGGGFWRASRGPTTISDYADGYAAFGGATLLAGFFYLQAATLMVGGLLNLLKNPGVGLLAMLFGAGLGWLTSYYYGRRVAVMRVAKPGELVVPHWPLRQGTSIQVAYGRALKPECRLRHLFAELQLFETCTHTRHGKRHTEVRLIERIDLGDGGGRQTPEGLHAVFDVDVPHPDGSCPRTGFAAFWAKLGFGPKRQWRLRVHLAVDGLPDDDSQFILAIQEARAGEAVAPRRRRSRAA